MPLRILVVAHTAFAVVGPGEAKALVLVERVALGNESSDGHFAFHGARLLRDPAVAWDGDRGQPVVVLGVPVIVHFLARFVPVFLTVAYPLSPWAPASFIIPGVLKDHAMFAWLVGQVLVSAVSFRDVLVSLVSFHGSHIVFLQFMFNNASHTIERYPI